MVDKIQKTLKKMISKQRQHILIVIRRIRIWDLAGLDVKKLEGVDNKYRIRVGAFRVICRKLSEEEAEILSVDRRSESTYRDV